MLVFVQRQYHSDWHRELPDRWLTEGIDPLLIQVLQRPGVRFEIKLYLLIAIEFVEPDIKTKNNLLTSSFFEGRLRFAGGNIELTRFGIFVGEASGTVEREPPGNNNDAPKPPCRQFSNATRFIIINL